MNNLVLFETFDIFFFIKKINDDNFEYKDASTVQDIILKIINKKIKTNDSLSFLSANQKEYLKYGIVVYIDELILSSNLKLKDRWYEMPLQLREYGELNGGDKFFTYINNLNVEFEKNKHILEIYYLILSLGFKGKYLLHEKEQDLRLNILKNLSKKIYENHNHQKNNANIQEIIDKNFIKLDRFNVSLIFGFISIASISYFLMNNCLANMMKI